MAIRQVDSSLTLLMAILFRWIVSGAGDSSFIHLKVVFPYVLRFVCGGFFRNDMSFLSGGRGRSGDSPVEINLNFDMGESPLLPLPVSIRKCHSELIHHAQLQIPIHIRWINEESHSHKTN